MKTALTFVLLLMASALLATPPRIFSSKDQMIGANQTHIYVLRTLRDNSGSHFTDRRDVYLLEISVATAGLENFWRVWSGVANSVDAFPGESESLGADFANPYEILRQKKAALVEMHAPHADFGYKIKNGALITNYGDPSGASGAKTYLSRDALREIASAQFAPILANYLPIADATYAQKIDMTGAHLLVEPIDQVDNCQVEASAMPIGSWENPQVPILIRCQMYPNEPELSSFSFFVFTPDWRAEGGK